MLTIAFVLVGINAVGKHFTSGLMSLTGLLESDLGEESDREG
jgi:hypothetical protein